MPNRRNYPATVAEILDPNKKYAPDALRAMRAFRAAKPWRCTDAERLLKFDALVQALSRVYNLAAPTLIHSPQSRASSYYDAGSNTIVLCGTLSVLTLLHELCHARGMDEREACAYSINLFKRIFPQSYARLTPVGHTLRRINPTTPPAPPPDGRDAADRAFDAADLASQREEGLADDAIAVDGE